MTGVSTLLRIAAVRAKRSIRYSGLRSAFSTATQTSDPWLLECQLSPSTHGNLHLQRTSAFRPSRRRVPTAPTALCCRFGPCAPQCGFHRLAVLACRSIFRRAILDLRTTCRSSTRHGPAGQHCRAANACSALSNRVSYNRHKSGLSADDFQICPADGKGAAIGHR